jgi:prophage regulatory protein
MFIVRLPAVLKMLGYKSHASIYNSVKEGLFTKPVSLGLRSVGWPIDEVRVIAAARIAGSNNDQLIEIVKKLHAKRLQQFAELQP